MYIDDAATHAAGQAPRKDCVRRGKHRKWTLVTGKLGAVMSLHCTTGAHVALAGVSVALRFWRGVL